jgi:hypothetical protein
MSLSDRLVHLQPGRNFVVTFWITIPRTVRAGWVEAVTIKATSQGDPNKTAEVQLNTMTAYQLFLPRIGK